MTGIWRITWLLAVCLCLLAPAPGWAKAKAPVKVHHLPAAPHKVKLCGQPVPLQVPFVAEQFDREFVITVHDVPQVVMWLKRAQRYFPYITAQLAAAGMPNDLKYLAVAESSLMPRIKSSAGAVGLWQFIPATARRYGLRVNKHFDDRRNLQRSTRAALRYLKDLHQEFRSWPLAMAAYNAGERRIRNAIKDQGVHDYYYLVLPRETQRYVYRIMAVKVIMANPARYGFVLSPQRRYRPTKGDTVEIKLSRTLRLRTLARAASCSVRELKELNPELRSKILPPGRHRIMVPVGRAKGLDKRLKKAMQGKRAPKAVGKMAPAKRSGRIYVVKSGDNLSRIARMHRVKLKDIRAANGLSRTGIIKPGQRLVIPR